MPPPTGQQIIEEQTKTNLMPDITPEKEPPPKKPPVKQVKIEIYRKKGVTFFEFKIDENLEAIFKDQAKGETKSSKSWGDLKFYSYPEIIESQPYQQLLSEYGLFDDYGHAFIRESRFMNIAFLRTVGGKGTIKIKEDLPFAVVTQGVRNMTKFIKQFHEEFLTDYKVKAEITVEA